MWLRRSLDREVGRLRDVFGSLPCQIKIELFSPPRIFLTNVRSAIILAKHPMTR